MSLGDMYVTVIIDPTLIRAWHRPGCWA
jgi:hypothetical protein